MVTDRRPAQSDDGHKRAQADPLSGLEKQQYFLARGIPQSGKDERHVLPVIGQGDKVLFIHGPCVDGVKARCQGEASRFGVFCKLKK